MSTIDFPSGPSVGQGYSFGTKTWVWNGTGWAKVATGGQTFIGFVQIQNVQTVTAAFPFVPDDFVLLVHI